MLRTFSSSLLALLALAAAAWLSPASAVQCSVGGGTCFVVAAGGNSNSTSTWANTSNGSTCTCVPATTDNVVLDSAAGALSINAALSVGTFDASGTGPGGSGSPYTNTLTHAAGITLTINTASGNSLRFPSQMTYSPGNATSTVSFANTTGTATLTSGGKNLAAVTINTGAGGVVQGDDLNVTAIQNSTTTLTSGTFSSGSNGLTTAIFSSSNSNNRTLTLGTFLKVGGNVATAQSILLLSTTTGLVLNKNNAFIEVAAPATAILGSDIRTGGMPMNALIVDANNSFNSQLGFVGNTSWTTWTIGAGWVIAPSSTVTNALSGAAVFNGTPSRPIIMIMGAPVGSASTLSASSCTATYTSFSGVTVPTGCTAGSGVNYGGNTGVTITPPRFGGVIGG